MPLFQIDVKLRVGQHRGDPPQADSAQKPDTESRHLYAGGRLGSKQVALKLILYRSL